ncbi:MAG: hypothetical protein F7C34_00365 [Desulfurococcales archaeon]|nr:hypothetical protein [Desulfurococcales archaeon]
MSVRVSRYSCDGKTVLEIYPHPRPGSSRVNVFVDLSPSMDGKRIFIVKSVLARLSGFVGENIVLYGFCRDTRRIYPSDESPAGDPGEALVSQRICYATNPKPLLREIASSPIRSSIVVTDGEFNKPLHRALAKAEGLRGKTVHFVLVLPGEETISYYEGLSRSYGITYSVAEGRTALKVFLESLVAHGALESAPIGVEVEGSPYYNARTFPARPVRGFSVDGLLAPWRIVLERSVPTGESVSAVLLVRELVSSSLGVVEERLSRIVVPV